jgi:ABC-type Fe3+/spermidine/putrescine transport system ATPase subunit
MIKIESVSKSFGEKIVIEKLNLEVQKKEVIALLGPNGSGKTTLLNMIAGLIQPDKGNIYINNTMIYGTEGTKKINLKPSERKIGYVLQAIALFPHMKIQDNIAYGLKTLHLPKSEIKTKTNKLLEFVNLTEHASAYPNQLSGGQKQLAALARSLATEPQILLLDEPASTIDPQLKEAFQSELKKHLQTIETTTLYVTHNLNEATRMADKIAVIGNRHIEQIGNKTEIFDKTQSTFIAKFLGYNIFKGKAIKNQNGHLLIETNGTSLLSDSNPELIGKNVVITIKPEDITLSTEKTTNPNTNNNIPGTITEIIQMHSTTQITIDADFPIKIKTTATTIKNLNITIGDKIYATFNPSDVNVFSEKLSS